MTLFRYSRWAGAFVFAILLSFSLPAFSQQVMDSSSGFSVLNTAQSLYDTGSLDAAIDTLKNNLPRLSPVQKQSAYHLLAQSYLANDNPDMARESVAQLLELDSDFLPGDDDHPMFVDMVNEIRQNRVLLSSASITAEPESEVAAPVTIITRQDIRLSGARNIRELLATYVPGLVPTDHGANPSISMRSFNSIVQQSLLILLNGQRLNELSYNECVLDYSISLEKIREIEVLRGPASCVFGTMAFSGIVNIKTLEGSDVQGFETRLSYGKGSQFMLNLQGGVHRSDVDLFVWGNVWSSSGFHVYSPDNNVQYVERYRHKPSYDVGLTFKWKGLNLLLMTNYGNRSLIGVNDLISGLYTNQYTESYYPKINGSNPGFPHRGWLIGLDYAKTFGKFTVSVTGKFSFNDIEAYFANDSARVNDMFSRPAKFLFYYKYRTIDANGRVAAMYHYGKKGASNGNIMVGVNADVVRVIDGYYNAGVSNEPFVDGNGDMRGIEDSTYVFAYHESPAYPGTEFTISPFVQWKHRFSQHWVLNANGTYSIQKRLNGVTQKDFTYRLSMSYIHSDRFNVKLLYGRSAFPIPYVYRNKIPALPIVIFSEEPQSLHSDTWQLNTTWHISRRCQFNAAVYYNYYSNMFDWRMGGTEALKNEGRFGAIGVETQLDVNLPRFMLNLNTAYSRSLFEENYKMIASNGASYDVPKLSANLTVGYKLLNTKKHGLWLRSTTRVYGSRITAYKQMESLPTNCIVNAGVIYQYKGFDFEFNAYNIGNTQYALGSSSLSLYYQEPFSFLGTFRWKLRR
ncbi:MAG: TonB-dependent receptor plug domain-containing protein [Bacteroidaceae bacterium]|nr:TonB-dependent receptor plug domain-containing protein [Bacteroidaceae bacterium]